jgi:hypothetical protein
LNGLAIVEYNSVMVVQNSKFGLGLGAAEWLWCCWSWIETRPIKENESTEMLSLSALELCLILWRVPIDLWLNCVTNFQMCYRNICCLILIIQPKLY